jgi:hypothetical protein
MRPRSRWGRAGRSTGPTPDRPSRLTSNGPSRQWTTTAQSDSLRSRHRTAPCTHVRSRRSGATLGWGQEQRPALFVLEDEIIRSQPLRERLLAALVRDRAIAVAVENDDRYDASARPHRRLKSPRRDPDRVDATRIDPPAGDHRPRHRRDRARVPPAATLRPRIPNPLPAAAIRPIHGIDVRIQDDKPTRRRDLVIPGRSRFLVGRHGAAV